MLLRLKRGSFRTLASIFLVSTSSRAMTTITPTIRWGILSAGKISSDFSQAIQATHGAEATAIAARQFKSAQAFGKQHNIEKCYGNYDELLQDDDIDVVYVGSIADQHKNLAVKCIQAGKATVVEKPLALSYEDCKELVDLARSHNVFLMEGLWTRCFPATLQVQELIKKGVIGRPVMIQGDFGWSSANSGPDDRIWFPDSGGYTLDVGMYMANLGQVAYGSDCQVKNIQAMGTLKNGVDHMVAANCMYKYKDAKKKEQTGLLQFYVTGEANTEERVLIQGTKGRILMEPPAHAPKKIRLELDQGRGSAKIHTLEFPLPEDTYTTWNYPGSIGFTHQISVVNECLRKGLKECPYYTWDNSLQVAAMLDVIRGQVLNDGSNKIDNSIEEEPVAMAQ